MLCRWEGQHGYHIAFFMVISGPCEIFPNPRHYLLLAHNVSCVLTNTIALNDFGAISGQRGFPPCWEALGNNAGWCVRKGELGAGVCWAPGGKETSQAVLQRSGLRSTQHTEGLRDLSRKRERAISFHHVVWRTHTARHRWENLVSNTARGAKPTGYDKHF